jgi:ATP-dependent Clp protease ATP-binding subunit ClpC
MSGRYTQRQVLFSGRYEAIQLGSPTIETEHLLLGILRENPELASRIDAAALSAETIRKDIESQVVVREKGNPVAALPLSAECNRVLEYAAEEADQRSQEYIGTEEFLLAILREDGCLAAKILQNRGLRLEIVRERLNTTRRSHGHG